MTLAIAALTIREAGRRRLLLALMLLTAVVIGLTGWGFHMLTTLQDHGQQLAVTEQHLLASQLLIMVMFMFSFVLGLSTIFMASSSVAGEVESGVVLAMLPRPLRRAEMVAGKWLGLATVISVYAIAAGAVEFLVVWLACGYAPPHPLQALAFLVGEGLTALSLALLLSTRLSALTAGVIGAFLFGMAWMGGVTGQLGIAFSNVTVERAGLISSLILPTDGLWRGTIFNLEPGAVLALASSSASSGGFPLFASQPPPPTYLTWALAWVVGAVTLAAWSLSRRDL